MILNALDEKRRLDILRRYAILEQGRTSPQRLAEATASGNALLHKPVAAEEPRRAVEVSLRA
ncbi:MAG: hypothetical protein AB1918_08330 [Pseudomonadota bacterium]